MTDDERFDQWLSEAPLEDLKKALSPESLDILKMNFMDSGAYDDALDEYIESAFNDDAIEPSQFSSQPWLELYPDQPEDEETDSEETETPDSED